MEDLELEVGTVVRLVCDCLNGRMYFLCCLSQIFLEEKMSNVGGRPFGMVIRADFLMELSFLDGGHLVKTGDSVGRDVCRSCKSGLSQFGSVVKGVCIRIFF